MTIEAASTKAGSTHKQRRIINMSSSTQILVSINAR
jgi:hypothetical protein